uniref:NB-ARC domain-containing protein n=1 Tax=Oryza punctata TaxID=4537 RepID=A0A0E0LAJ1_ORYPU
MAETALSLVGSAISKASSVATEEMSLLINVQTEIWYGTVATCYLVNSFMPYTPIFKAQVQIVFCVAMGKPYERYIKDELKTMQAFLNAAELMKEKDELLKVWAGQVRDLAYDIEDCLDAFRVHLEHQGLLRQLKKLKHHHKIAIMIRNLKSRAEDVRNRNRRYRVIHIMPSNSNNMMDSYTEDIHNVSVNNIDEASLLGLDGPKGEVLQMLDIPSSSGPTKVICVVGMGGLGKTTLANMVYESNVILDKFLRRAWITVSQSFDIKELLIDMIMKLLVHISLTKSSKELQRKQSFEEPQNKQVEELENPRMLTKEQKVQEKRVELQSKKIEELSHELTQGLNELRYFIVLDDIWKIDDCNWIKSLAFPEKNNEGSRVIVTTRDVGLAEMFTSLQLIYHLEPLKYNDAKLLLLRKTNKTQEDLEKEMRMLRVLDLKDAQLTVTQQDINKIGSLYHLKYLFVSGNSSIYALPRSIGNLQGVRVPKGIGKLTSLQVLKVVDIKRSGMRIMKDITKLTQLRKLSLVRVTKMHEQKLGPALQKLSYLRSLSIDTYELRWLGSILPPTRHLQSLKLDGCLSPLPSWVATLTKLTKIYLGSIPMLKEYDLEEISPDFMAKVAKLDTLQKEVDKHPNHPMLTMKMSRSVHDLGDIEVSEVKERSTRPSVPEVGQSSQSVTGPDAPDNPTTAPAMTN